MIQYRWHIRWPFVVLIVAFCAFVWWAIKFSVIPKHISTNQAQISINMFYTKNSIMQFVFQHRRLPRSLAELNKSLDDNDLRDSDAGMVMEDRGNGIIVLEVNGFQAVFRAYKVDANGTPRWSQWDPPWATMPHRMIGK